MNIQEHIANFCESIRKAITTLGCSTELARNVVNAELGQFKHVKTGDDSHGKVKITKGSKTKAPKGKFTYRPGMMTFEGKVSVAVQFAAYNEVNIECEKLCASHSIVIDPDGMFGQWLKRVASPKVTPTVPAETIPNAEQVNPTDTTTVSQ